MRTHDVEVSFRRWVEETLNLPEKHRDRVAIHWAGENFADNCLMVIVPRITRYARTGPRDGDIEIVTIQVTVAVKVEPGLELFGVLSLLVDEVRRTIDSTRRDEVGDPAAVTQVFNREGAAELCLDFGPAQETRSYGTTIQVGGVSLVGVDLAVLTAQAQTSPLKPRVNVRT